jgi:hypothetical protein
VIRFERITFDIQEELRLASASASFGHPNATSGTGAPAIAVTRSAISFPPIAS